MNVQEFLAKNDCKEIDDDVIDTSNVVGKKVWICDFRLGKDGVYSKPIRHVKPTEAEVDNIVHSKKTIYYSPIYFKAGKKEIAPYDNTGYRSCPGSSLQIFENEQECRAFYKSQVDGIKKQYFEAIESFTNSMNAKIKELEDEE